MACIARRRNYAPGMPAQIFRLFFAPLALAGLLTGCHAPPKPGGPTTAVWRISDFDAFLDDTLSVLRECDLPPARVERTSGLVVTEPATSAQWFEWWRSDARGGYQALESSLHTIRRTVTLHAVSASAADGDSPVDQDAAAPETTVRAPAPAPVGDDESAPTGGAYRITIQVDKQRRSAPNRQVTTASGALAIYNERIPTELGQRGARSRELEWVSLGRDVLLEEYLLARLAGLPQVDLLPTAPPAAEESGR